MTAEPGWSLVDLSLPRDLLELETKIDAHLAQLGVSVWGRAFDVNDPNGRAKAAEWLARQIVGLYEGPEWLRG